MTESAEKKKRNKGKKHISKHVLKAREAKEEAKKEAPQKAPSKTKKPKAVVKDPSEAMDYLKQWKHDKGAWKFNKNTQSWIIRHMYDAEKLDKAAFSLVTEYLQGLQGGTAKTWVVADATKRALRYKEYEKSQGTGGDGDSKDAEKKGTDNATKDETEDRIRWKKLSDHDKRKEYKRARKVLEVLKE
ncbi:hypothetical protein FisN_18Hh109 [Fistulifera solaris]|jgi:hypothetical protein|uniref:WKF domain-containing protein n=1 Tax=Fistulifera solaris TaxID=1519565 RepID=A0A1Z5JV32_FISSO|nr:hypothetical protein FisN_18Hh109 [Fistulifera solaris]|eukprot:GAX17903.1 hypothetical protein FisN_18Hh109 [Fistulifera solaris]